MSTPAPTPAPLTPAPRRRSGWVIPVLALVVALVVGGLVGVLVGRATAPASSPFSASGRTYGGFRNGVAGGTSTAAPGGFASGTVDAVSGNTLTITTAQGTKETVTFSGSTRVTKTATASTSALKAGEHVTVVGTPSGSSGITATVISEGAGGFGRRAGTAGTRSGS